MSGPTCSLPHPLLLLCSSPPPSVCYWLARGRAPGWCCWWWQGRRAELGAHVSPAAHTRTAKVKWRCFSLPLRPSVQPVNQSLLLLLLLLLLPLLLLLLLLLLLPERQTVPFPGLRGSSSSEEQAARGGSGAPERRTAGQCVRGELRVGMGALTKGRYLSTAGLLLLVYCTVSVICKGKSCVSVSVHVYFQRHHRAVRRFTRRGSEAALLVPSSWLRTTCPVFSIAFADIVDKSGGLCSWATTVHIQFFQRWSFWFTPPDTYCDCWSFLLFLQMRSGASDINSSSRSWHCQVPTLLILIVFHLKSMLIAPIFTQFLAVSLSLSFLLMNPSPWPLCMQELWYRHAWATGMSTRFLSLGVTVLIPRTVCLHYHNTPPLPPW